MRYTIILVFFCLILPLKSSGQKHDYNWLFGNSSGWDYVDGSRINFNTIPITIEEDIRDFISFHGANVSMSDAEGRLMFYTNGCVIADSTDTVMENGDGINPGEVHDLQCYPNGSETYTSGWQSMMGLPKPGSENIFYLFHKGLVYDDTGGYFYVWNMVLYSTIIDMSLNNGLGDVVEKNVSLIQDTLVAGALTAVKHANGEDWWIITDELHSNKYYTWLLTSNGIEGPFEQKAGLPDVVGGNGGGLSVFNQDGSKFIRYTPTDDIFLFDFDRSSGKLTNFLLVPVEDDAYIGGVAVSPNNRFLYVSSYESLLQYDLEAEDIKASEIIIDTLDYSFTDPFPQHMGTSQLAPDCRIYIFSSSTHFIHVIHFPDELGTACSFEQHAVELPNTYFRTAPIYPNYRMSPMDEPFTPPCESPVATVQPQWFRTQTVVFPNPTSDRITVLMPEFNDQKAFWQLFSSTGRLILDRRMKKELNVDVSQLPSGMYFWTLESQNGRLESGKLVVSR